MMKQHTVCVDKTIMNIVLSTHTVGSASRCMSSEAALLSQCNMTHEVVYALLTRNA